MLGDDFLDDRHGLVEVAFRLLDLQAEVELGLDGVAELSRGVDVGFRRHDVRLAAVAHLTRKRAVGFPVGVKCDYRRVVDATGDEGGTLHGSPASEVIVGVGHFLRENEEEIDAAGARGHLVVLPRLLVGDGVCDLIE